jgi:hypothetical protein
MHSTSTFAVGSRTITLDYGGDADPVFVWSMLTRGVGATASAAAAAAFERKGPKGSRCLVSPFAQHCRRDLRTVEKAT